MSFKSKDLSVLAYANGFTWWHYKSDEDNIVDAVDNSEEYWTDSADMVRAGDIITANLNGRTGILTVQSVESGVVRVVSLSGFS